ncbi:MAG TPA: hypothetical protein VIK54_05780 [Acidimicrobiia bacterium]
MKPCVFCGSGDGMATDEHVIPKWARNTFKMRGPLRLNVGEEPGDEVRFVAGLTHLKHHTAAAICSDCNNGYLSKISIAVQPILSR